MFWLTYILLAFVVGKYASNKGKNFISWLTLALLLSPLIAWLFILVSKDGNSTETSQNSTKKCLYCAETVKKEATKCKHCGADLPAISSL